MVSKIERVKTSKQIPAIAVGPPVQSGSKYVQFFDGVPFTVKTGTANLVDPLSVTEEGLTIRVSVSPKDAVGFGVVEEWAQKHARQESLTFFQFKSFHNSEVISVKVPPTALFYDDAKHRIQREELAQGTPVQLVLELPGIQYGLTEFGVLWHVKQVMVLPQPEPEPEPQPEPEPEPVCLFDGDDEEDVPEEDVKEELKDPDFD